MPYHPRPTPYTHAAPTEWVAGELRAVGDVVNDVELVGASFDLEDASVSDTLYFDGEKWIPTDAIKIDPSNSVDLHHNGSLSIRTTNTGSYFPISGFEGMVVERIGTAEGGVNFRVASGAAPGMRFRLGNPDLGSSANNLAIRIQHTSGNNFQHQWLSFFYGGGVTAGVPTGGDKGIGTINAVAVYDDNTLLTDYVFDAALDGTINLEKWDASVPNRIIQAEDGEGRGEGVEVRQHEPARRFIRRMDDLNPAEYARKWQTRRKLPAFDDGSESVQLSVGDYSQRLLETCEVQAIHIEALRLRIEALWTTTQELLQKINALKNPTRE